MSSFDFSVLIPWGIGFAATVIALSKACKLLFERFYNVSYHAILGITVASLIIIIPTKFSGPLEVILSIVFALLGFFAAFFMEKMKSKIE